MQLTQDDHSTILAYFVANYRAAGYEGPVFICIKRLAEIHLENSISMANQAIKKMMVKA